MKKSCFFIEDSFLSFKNHGKTQGITRYLKMQLLPPKEIFFPRTKERLTLNA